MQLAGQTAEDRCVTHGIGIAVPLELSDDGFFLLRAWDERDERGGFEHRWLPTHAADWLTLPNEDQ